MPKNKQNITLEDKFKKAITLEAGSSGAVLSLIENSLEIRLQVETLQLIQCLAQDFQQEQVIQYQAIN